MSHQIIVPGGGGIAGGGSYGARHAGGASIETWYIGGVENASTIGAGGATLIVDTLYAVPYHSGRGGTLDRIAFEITTVGGASSKCRVGIYKATSLVNIYPSARIVDGGEEATNAAGTNPRAATINTTLLADTLYWFAILATGGGGAVVSVRVISAITASGMVCGYVSTLGASTLARNNLQVAQAYGALPDPFPAGATFNAASPFAAGNIPVIAVRYSA